MAVPFHDFKKEYADGKDGIDKAIGEVLASGHYILGPKVEEFERAFAQYLGVSDAVGVANGMEALQIALMAAGIGPGDEVITTSLSAVATALAIKAVGALPVFVDTDEYYHLDAAAVAQKITPKTKAILPVHLYGQPADIEALQALASEHSLILIEDCAQAHGAEYRGKKVGSFGMMGCFSFYPTKNLGTYGDGGAIVTNDPALPETMRMLRNYGQKDRYEHTMLGLNSRLDALHAAVLLAKLPRLDAANERRRAVAQLYKKELAGIAGIRLPNERAQVAHVYHLFVIEAERRDALQAHLKERGIDSLIHYPTPIHKQPAFKEYADVSLPTLERQVQGILSLPCHPFLSETEVKEVCEAIRSFYAQ
jgi:dTDP-3-amino-3,4,6-trideoxy-alpha-D-glucose transaminase